MVQINITIGELVDRITILKIKHERLQDLTRWAAVSVQLAQHLQLLTDAGFNPAQDLHFKALLKVNNDLWEIEDELRAMEASGNYNRPEFIMLARRVYKMNDKRAELKRAIDENYGTDPKYMEIKEYPDYA
jgi:hypothetical protein